MTLEEFLKHCEVIPFQRSAFGPAIRSKRYQECPVCAVANKVLGEKRYRLNHIVAAAAIGLDAELANIIAACADHDWSRVRSDESYHELRRRLETFCK